METIFDMMGMTTMGAEGKHVPSMLQAMSRAGLRTAEISSNVCWEWPHFSPQFRRELKKALEPFRTITMHGGTIQIDTDEEPAKPLDAERLAIYLQLMDLGHDLGARYVTFHPLMTHKYDIMLAPRFRDAAVVAQHVQVGRFLITHVRQKEMAIGFEAFDIRIAEGVVDERWGAFFDIGHASQNGVRSTCGNLTEQAMNMIEQRLHRIV